MAQTTSAWWRRHPRQPAAARVPDPADMGTAFGLEFILDQPPAPAAGPVSAASPPFRASWWRRLFAPRNSVS